MPNPFNTPGRHIEMENIPVFAPKKIISVTAGEVWTPDDSDRAFYSSQDTTMTLGASGSTYVMLSYESVIGIIPGMVFKFSTNVDLAVM